MTETQYVNASNSDWNDERVGQLQTLFGDGLSFRQIANEIGTTRNAAISKAHRLNLRRIRIKPLIEKSARPPRPRARSHWGVVVASSDKSKPPDAMPPVVPPEPVRDQRCTIYHLRNNTCRWPMWPTGTPHHERMYCGAAGADLAAGVPYCRRHRPS